MKKMNLVSRLFQLLSAAMLFIFIGTLSYTFAQHDAGGHSGGYSGSHGGSHSDGHDSGDDHDDEEEGHSGGKGRYGAGGGRGRGHDVARDTSVSIENRIFRGRRPVWAREGIPEVELGRLNVGRAPTFVLARAEDKALEEFVPSMGEIYNLSAEEAAILLRDHYDELVRIHSPVQNLALYKDIMMFEQTQLPGVIPASTYDLAAIFLGSASDKNIPISNDTIIAINRILGLVEMSQDDISILANKAENVRLSILAGHGDITHSEPSTH